MLLQQRDKLLKKYRCQKLMKKFNEHEEKFMKTMARWKANDERRKRADEELEAARGTVVLSD